jgi:anti-sigma regulatory factor (Ser/Thr protein kinase)
MKSHSLASATRWITRAAHDHGEDLVAHVVQHLGISRRRARRLLASLVAAQWLVVEGAVRRPRFRPGPLRQVVHRYALAGLQEDLPWAHDFAPLLSLRPNVASLAQHAFTELLNNAIDHSGGTHVTVSVRQTAMYLQMLVSDDGCGLFDRIQQTWQIGDARLAMLELAKGKLSSDPDRHCGHGLFFTARCADMLDLHANRQAFQRRPGHDGWFDVRPQARDGTTIFLAIDLDTPRTLDAVLRSHAVQGHGIDTTVVPLRLLTGPQIGLMSRAQARRVSARLAQFGRARLDFEGIADIGPAFADELFRVYARSHPQVTLVPQGVSPRVAAMIASVR